MVARVQEFLWHIAYVMSIGLKNDFNGVMRGPYLSRSDKRHRTTENIVRTPRKI